jgi:hypothetical protein
VYATQTSPDQDKQKPFFAFGQVVPSNFETKSRSHVRRDVPGQPYEGLPSLSMINSATLAHSAVSSRLETISLCAFHACWSLPEIWIPSSVVALGKACSSECSSLQNITFENGSRILRIESEPFPRCSSLSSIVSLHQSNRFAQSVSIFVRSLSAAHLMVLHLFSLLNRKRFGIVHRFFQFVSLHRSGSFPSSVDRLI